MKLDCLMFDLNMMANFSVTSDEIKKVSNPLVTLTHEKSRQEKEVGNSNVFKSQDVTLPNFMNVFKWKKSCIDHNCLFW